MRRFDEETLKEIREKTPYLMEMCFYAEKAKGQGYHCPRCSNGTKGGTRTGKNGETYTKAANGLTPFRHRKTGEYMLCCTTEGCFVGDIIKYYQEMKSVDFVTAVNELAPIANTIVVTEETEDDCLSTGPIPSDFTNADFVPYYKVCADRLQVSPVALDYMAKRGISAETCKKMWIGFDPRANPIKRPGDISTGWAWGTARIIIPVRKNYYQSRAIYDKDTRYCVGGKEGTYYYNNKAIENPAGETLIICEGCFDALSCIEMGFPAVASFGKGKLFKFVKALEGSRLRCYLVPDNDEGAGHDDTVHRFETLQGKLKKQGVFAEILRLDETGYGDLNELLSNDREKFKAWLTERVK